MNLNLLPYIAGFELVCRLLFCEYLYNSKIPTRLLRICNFTFQTSNTSTPRRQFCSKRLLCVSEMWICNFEIKIKVWRKNDRKTLFFAFFLVIAHLYESLDFTRFSACENRPKMLKLSQKGQKKDSRFFGNLERK